MKTFIVVVSIVITSIFFISFSFFKRDYVDIAEGIRDKVGKNLAKKHHMDFIGTTGGMIECVRIIGFDFSIYRIIDQDQARCIIVDCVEELLKAFNENQKIRPFLLNYPFTTKNINVSICISDQKGQDLYEPYINFVGIYKENQIVYRMENRSRKIYEAFQETYQEALAKVKNSCQSTNDKRSQFVNTKGF